MNRLADKTIIWFLCLITCIMSDDVIAPVIAILVSAGASSLTQFFSGRRSSFIIIAAESVLCIIFPVGFCTAPLIFYDALCEKRKWLCLPAFGALINASQFKVIQLSLIALGFVLSMILYKRTYALAKITEKLHETRDNAIEQHMILAQKNQRLRETQDNEIHLATLKERNRIAREIHDNVGHMLTRSLLQAGALIVTSHDEMQKSALCDLKDTLDNAMTSIRTSVHDLHDDSIDLKHAAEEYLKPSEMRFNVQLDLDISENVPQNIKLCILGVLKESISNAVKHSNGDRIRVIIREHPAFYQLSVTDNGKCSKINNSGIGLANMRERAENEGGIISFTPSENGFRVFLSIPKNESLCKR
ncbi:MAG: sensor histidine kinase [Porcipelethomonas sp.]